MTTEHQASRTILKSPPELWAECSDAGSLARHIGEFGEIRIARLEPETTVAWEGEHASGTVDIEPSGWGTRVTLTAQTKGDEVAQSGDDGVDAPEFDQVESLVVEAGGLGPPVSRGELAPPGVTDNRPVEEAADAKVEETSTQPDPVVAADPVTTRRWKRVMTLTRALFRPRGAPGEVQWASEARESPSFEVAESPAAGVVESPATYWEPTSADSAESLPTDINERWPTDVAQPPPLQGAGPPRPAVETAEVPEEADGTASIDPEAVLSAALDSLGQAHHRPFSRA